MSDSGKCRRCGAEIFWRKSQRTGRSYPVNPPGTNPRDFHECQPQNSQPSPVLKPITPSYDPPAEFDPEPSLEQRVADLETAVATMAKTIVEIRGRQPITDQDLPDF
jgi:hypothetical protein